MKMEKVREIFLSMASTCRSLEVARMHHENEDHAAAELMFNVSLEMLKGITQQDRVSGLKALDRMIKAKRKESTVQEGK